MTKLLILCGLSGSGKSTYAKNSPYEVVSSDAIRKEICPGGEEDQSMNDEVFRIFHKRIKNNIEQNIDTIADATFLTIKSRKQLAQYKCYKKVIVFNCSYEECCRRDKERKRTVSPEVIFRQMMRFQVPFLEEGWDKITVYNHQNKPLKTVNELFSDMIGFQQENPHHHQTLDIHSLTVAKRFGEKYPKYFASALLHDYGKLLTKTKNNNGIAHYYNHDKVGAYALLSSLKEEDIVDFCFLVNYHMLPFNWNTEKAMKKWKNIFGEEKFQMLMDFHQCDIEH